MLVRDGNDQVPEIDGVGFGLISDESLGEVKNVGELVGIGGEGWGEDEYFKCVG